MPLYKYTPYTTAGPNGVSLRFRADESGATELAEVDGAVYVHVPDGAVLPEQPVEIAWQPVTPDAVLLARIKAESRSVQLIAQAMIEKIARDQLAQMTPQAPPAQPEPQAPQVPQQGGPMNGQ